MFQKTSAQNCADLFYKDQIFIVPKIRHGLFHHSNVENVRVYPKYALGYSSGSDALKRHVDDDDKLKYQISTAGQLREQTIIVISEQQEAKRTNCSVR